MVVICDKEYTNSIFAKHFEAYPFELSDFQKHAIQGIVEGNHVLVTAHTGSGKTLPAEFAIEHFHSKGKKVIYTSPIKALSNQKYYEFTKQFPNISFGILTGDIKFNPEADVLIMTTEILQNSLYQLVNSEPKQSNSNLHFQMDLHNELGCVIFDEIHYINDADRGKVWEESILMLPDHIQMVMLSATIDKAEEFALWCEQRHGNENDKCVILAPTNHRVVPLTHYAYINCTQSIFKHERNKEIHKKINNTIGMLHVLKDSKGVFKDDTYENVKEMLDLFSLKQIHINPSYILNSLAKCLFANGMLPALCFVLSRKNVEKYASQITVTLFEEGSKVPSMIKRECQQILRKLPNYDEYYRLPEFTNMIKLLEKGIAIHHSGVMPILREMVELLFGKGYIKLLFATETFAVGINMPTKTVIFTGMSKFTGTNMRHLLAHEYTQMAGRAGRRGLDTVGHVIHCNNLFTRDYPSLTDYKCIMSGKPQRLVSKFKISYNMVFNLLTIGNSNIEAFTEKSMLQNEIRKEVEFCEAEVKTKRDSVRDDSYEYKTPIENIQEYLTIEDEKQLLKNKQLKKALQRQEKIRLDNPCIDGELEMYRNERTTKRELDILIQSLNNTQCYVHHNVQNILDLLSKRGFVRNVDSSQYELTDKGVVASGIREIHPLLVGDLYFEDVLQDMTSIELIGLFSCFANVNVHDDNKFYKPHTKNYALTIHLPRVKQLLEDYMDDEHKYSIDTGVAYEELNYDLMDYAMDWCNSSSESECKFVLEKMSIEKEIFLGEFVKALLKILNISKELESICETEGNIELLSKLTQIPTMIQKYVVTNQSLYV